MNYIFSLILFLLVSISYSCKEKNKVNQTVTEVPLPPAKMQEELNYYNSIVLFRDSAYRLTTHQYDTLNDFDASRNNTSVTFSKKEAGVEKIIFRDSLFCMFPQIELQDINNDKAEDILVFHYTGARANPSYYLYITDAAHKNLIRIKGFENLTNPDLDMENNVIVSYALSGKNHYQFYRIDENFKLSNLGFGYTENENDPGQYSRAMAAIYEKFK